jgi:predicted transcriptional regulator
MKFSTTPKGVLFIRTYEQMSQISDQFREQSILAK